MDFWLFSQALSSLFTYMTKHNKRQPPWVRIHKKQSYIPIPELLHLSELFVISCSWKGQWIDSNITMLEIFEGFQRQIHQSDPCASDHEFDVLLSLSRWGWLPELVVSKLPLGKQLDVLVGLERDSRRWRETRDCWRVVREIWEASGARAAETRHGLRARVLTLQEGVTEVNN